MSTAIKVENLSKAYQIGQIGTGTISRDLERWWITKIKGKEDPFLKIGELNDRSTKGNSDIVWSLKDINFEIKQGDAVGVIGRNGAGKSTLLKVLSEITSPTTGKINIKGRVASLLEVGTGFHPELTGRENIYLNGAIMGMRKKEIQSKFDEIVDFSGVERYIDTPVKRYSSGMYVRLAFGVAAHLEPEILIVDEVLAVGDAEFQKKALGKMQDVSKGEGRTILFVSHNMAAIASLCNQAIILKDGQLSNMGETDAMISEYINISKKAGSIGYDDSAPKYEQKLKIRGIKILNEQAESVSEINNSERAFLDVTIEVFIEGKGYDIGLELLHTQYGSIFSTGLKDANLDSFSKEVISIGMHTYRLELPMHFLRGGEYIINIAAAIPKVEMLDIFKHETHFTIVDLISPVSKTTEGRSGAILPIIQWLKI